MDIDVVIANNNSWICLNGIEYAFLSQLIRKNEEFRAVDGHTFYGDEIMKIDGNFELQKEEDWISIKYSKEGDENTIGMCFADIIAMLKIEKIVNGKMQNIAVEKGNVIVEIETLASKFRDDAYLIKRSAEDWFCTDIVREMSTTHFQFFFDFIQELSKQSN